MKTKKRVTKRVIVGPKRVIVGQFYQSAAQSTEINVLTWKRVKVFITRRKTC